MYCSSKLTVLTYRTKMQGKRIRHSDIVHGVACRARCVYRMSCPVKRRPDRRPEPHAGRRVVQRLGQATGAPDRTRPTGAERPAPDS